uniref:Uncharacterized protein n=2 Tax=Cercopithecidae TaxID=9527 RepID=A0A2K5HEB2_COLAP|nr:unnamed protein product [Macaca fascicularis]
MLSIPTLGPSLASTNPCPTMAQREDLLPFHSLALPGNLKKAEGTSHQQRIKPSKPSQFQSLH